MEKFDETEPLPLHLYYRPRSFDEFIGNDSVVESLKNTLANTRRIVRSFLLYGPSGCGKTTLARIIKSELGCSDRDFYEYNMANTRGIDTIRDIISNTIYAPMKGTVKIYLIDECHKLTVDAQNSMLKILEDTPEHVRFILCTTDPQKLLTTIRNRCAVFSVSTLPVPKIVSLIKKISGIENIELPVDVIREISKVSSGSPRQALVLLEQVSTLQDKSIENVRRVISGGILDETKTLDLCRALIEKNWPEVCNMLKGINEEPENIRYSVLGYFSGAMLRDANDVIAGQMASFTESFIPSGKAGLILACYLACK